MPDSRKCQVCAFSPSWSSWCPPSIANIRPVLWLKDHNAPAISAIPTGDVDNFFQSCWRTHVFAFSNMSTAILPIFRGDVIEKKSGDKSLWTPFSNKEMMAFHSCAILQCLPKLNQSHTSSGSFKKSSFSRPNSDAMLLSEKQTAAKVRR